MPSMIFVQVVKRLIYSNRTVTIKCYNYLASFNSYVITYLAFSYGYWNVHVHNIWLAVAIPPECIATIAIAVLLSIGQFNVGDKISWSVTHLWAFIIEKNNISM